MNILPKARTENLIEQNLKNEVPVYDLITNKAYNETSSIVYKACNGKTTFDELKRKYRFTDDFIYLALDELKRNSLLTDSYQSPFANANRREIIKKVGLATIFALPIITGLVAPTAIHASSVCACPRDLPATCQEGGFVFPVGCYKTSDDCTRTIFEPEVKAACGDGRANETQYSRITGCCRVSCSISIQPESIAN